MTNKQEDIANLLRLFQIKYSGASKSESVVETSNKTVEITFKIEYRLVDTVNDSESDEVLRGRSVSYLVSCLTNTVRKYMGILKDLDSEIATLLTCEGELRNHPNNHRIILERLFKAMKSLSRRSTSRAKLWSSLEQAYWNVIHCIDFPYYIIRNAGDVLLGEDSWVLTRKLTSENFINLIEFLNEHNDSVSCSRTVICNPGDILFIANPYRIPSYWANLYFNIFKYGCQLDEVYVKKVYPNVSHLSGMNELTPFYFCRLKQDISCKIEIILTNVIGLTSADRSYLNFTEDFSYQGHMLSPGIQDYNNSLNDLLQISDTLPFSSYGSSGKDVNWGKGLSYQRSY